MATEQPVARLRDTDGSDHKRRIVIDFAARRSDLTPSEFLGNLIARVTMLDHLQLRAGAGNQNQSLHRSPRTTRNSSFWSTANATNSRAQSWSMLTI